MYIIVIGWMFVVILMFLAEAMDGSITGAFLTLLVYGVLPVSILAYLLDTPGRKHRRRAEQERQATDCETAPQTDPTAANATGHADHP